MLVGLCLCALFLLIYPSGQMCRLFEYVLVLLCFAYVCYYRGETKDGLLSLLAMLCTVFADFFLVALKEEQVLPGMAIFCAAQLCWSLRLLLWEDGRRRIIHAIVWAFTCGALLIVAVLLVRGVDVLLMLSAVYG